MPPAVAFKVAITSATPTIRPSAGFCRTLHWVTLISDALKSRVRLRLTTNGLRTVEKRGGIDAFLLSTPDAKLEPAVLRIKRRVKRAQEKTAA